MRTDLFDFALPPERIALRPVSPRDSARLLVVRPGTSAAFEDRGVRDLPDLLRPGDALVFNDTKVIAARPRPRPRRDGRRGAAHRGDFDPTARRVALARAGAAGEEVASGRHRPFRR